MTAEGVLVVVQSPQRLVRVEDQQVRVIAVGGQGPAGPPGVGAAIPLVSWFWREDLVVAQGVALFPVYGDWELVAVTAEAETAPQGDDAILDVFISGVSVWAAPDRLTIPAGQTTGVHGPFALDSMLDGDVLRNDCDQPGTVLAGANVTVTAWALPA